MTQSACCATQMPQSVCAAYVVVPSVSTTQFSFCFLFSTFLLFYFRRMNFVLCSTHAATQTQNVVVFRNHETHNVFVFCFRRPHGVVFSTDAATQVQNVVVTRQLKRRMIFPSATQTLKLVVFTFDRRSNPYVE